jgi:hypothetical protein
VVNILEQRALEETYSRILGGSVDSAELIDLMGSMDDAALDGLLEAIEKMAGVLPTPTDEQVAQIQANPTGTAEDLAQIMGSTGGGSTSGYAGATGPYGGIYGSGPYYGGGQQPIVSVYEGGSAGGPWLGVFPD